MSTVDEDVPRTLADAEVEAVFRSVQRLHELLAELRPDLLLRLDGARSDAFAAVGGGLAGIHGIHGIHGTGPARGVL